MRRARRGTHPGSSSDRHQVASRVAFSARLGSALGSKPSLLWIRFILSEAQQAGYEPRLLYQQAVQARPPYWPDAPTYEQVIEPDGSALRDRDSTITWNQAVRIATEHLGRVPEFGGAKVREVVAWDEIAWSRPNLYNAPHGIQDSWVAYLDFPNEPVMIRSSRIIIVSRKTGTVLFAGDANDEG
jgi:hypothetical protein